MATGTQSAGGRTLPVINPATGEDIGRVPHAEIADLERAVRAAEKGFATWRKVSAFERCKLLRKGSRHAAEPDRNDRADYDP